jgi:flagellar motor switch protein FliM
MTVVVADELDAGTPAPEPYDFRRPAAIPRERMRRLASAFDTFADRWSTTLSARLHTDVVVEPVSLAALDYREVVDTLADDDAVVLCSVPGVEARGLVRVAVPALLGWVTRTLGGAGAPVAGRESLTAIEQAVVRRILEGAFDDLRYAFTGFLPIDLAVSSFPIAPRLASAARPDDVMLAAGFTVLVDGVRTPFALVLPATAVTVGTEDIAAPAPEAPADLLRAQIITVPVELALRLRPAPVSPATILDLAVGDVIALPHQQHRPLDLTVEGQIVAHAAIGAQSGHVACVVTDLEESE